MAATVDDSLGGGTQGDMLRQGLLQDPGPLRGWVILLGDPTLPPHDGYRKKGPGVGRERGAERGWGGQCTGPDSI